MKKTLQLLLVFLFFLAGNTAIAQVDDLILAGSSSSATIVVGENATETETYAAEELQRAIRIMSGIELPILSGSGGGTQIIIGTPAGNSKIDEAKARLHLDGSNDEQTAVLREGNIVYIGGQTPRAALYATYSFLGDVLGARWLWPGASGEYIPKDSVVSVGALNIFEVPSLRTRGLTNLRSTDAETGTWQARNRMNMVAVGKNTDGDSPEVKALFKKGFQTRYAGHFVVLPESILSAHPEYAALHNGSRDYNSANTAQLCWGNSGVQDEVAKLLEGLWEDHSFVDIIHFYPADNQSYCTDALCQALGPDVTTRWQKFSQIVMEKVDQKYPGKRYWTYAYQGYKEVPDYVAPRFESIGYTLYEASYRHLLSSGYAGSAGAIAEIEGWRAKGADMGIRGYEYIMFRDPMYVPLVSWEMDQMKWLADKGINMYLSEIRPFNSPSGAPPEDTYMMTNRMNLYAASRGMWNADITADSIVNDWCKTVYGPVADEMIAYYWDIENLWRTAPGDIQEYNNTPASQVNNFFAPNDFARLNGYFTRARTSLSDIEDAALRDRIEAQLDLESRMLGKWQTVYNYANNQAGRFETDIEKADSVNDATWKSVMKLPAFEDENGDAVAEQTIVSKLWTATDLHFRIVAQDDDIHARIANATIDDDTTILADDCLELFIQPDPDGAAYMHFAVNTLGTKYDAFSRHGGTDFDITWDPTWTVDTLIGDDSWTVDIKIPFSSLGITASDSNQFKLAVKRSRAGRADNSGWPDASYYNPGSFGTATLVSEVADPVSTRVILYDQGGTQSANVSTEFQKQGWQVVSNISGEDQLREKLNEDAAVLLIRYVTASTFLSTEFHLNELKDYLDKGRVVIIVAKRDSLPIEQWFPGTPAVTWSGYNLNYGGSRPSYIAPGAWKTYPNRINLEKPNPVSAYLPLGEGWTNLLEMEMKDSVDRTYLLTKQIGNGLLVLTSASMGYSGGYEVFGSRNIDNAVKLVDNLKAVQESFEGKREQTITMDSLSQKVLGEPDFAIAATSDSDLPITLSSSDSTVAIISNGMVNLTGVGTTIITASQEGDEIYEAAEQVSRELVVVADIIAPSVPKTLSATATDSTVTLTWEPSSDFVGVTGYNIYIGDELVENSNTTTVEVGGLNASVNYTFKVTAIDAAGNESPAAVLAVTTPDTQAPSAPPALTAKKSSKHEVVLVWRSSTDNVGVAGYYIYRNGTLLDPNPVTDTIYRAERPRGKDVYAFTVKAFDAADNLSPASNCAISANGEIKNPSPCGEQDGPINNGLQAEATETIMIYPNPSDGNFKISVNANHDGKIEIALFTAYGYLLKSTNGEKNGSYQKAINVRDLPPGTYIVRVIMNGFSKSKTITIQ